MRKWLVLCMIPVVIQAAAAGQCAVSLASSSDRTLLVGSYDGAGPWRVLVNGLVARSGAADQLLLLHADASTNDTGGRSPVVADGVSFAAGRWGSAFELSAGLSPTATLGYAREGAVDFREGTIEMWIDGADAAYAARDHVLFGYRAANGDTMNVAQSRTAGIVYAGGTVRGQWESAYGGKAASRAWPAGEWQSGRSGTHAGLGTGLDREASATEGECRQKRDREGLGTQVPGLSTGSEEADRDRTGEPEEIPGEGS
jgi:hypothetical protein